MPIERECGFYRVLEHCSSYGLSQLIQALHMANMLCSETR